MPSLGGEAGDRVEEEWGLLVGGDNNAYQGIFPSNELSERNRRVNW